MMSEKNKADYAGKMMEKDRNVEERDMHGQKEIQVKKMGETDESGYHRGQEIVSHNRSQIVFAFVGMEQSSVSAWWII